MGGEFAARMSNGWIVRQMAYNITLSDYRQGGIKYVYNAIFYASYINCVQRYL